ncbi:MAG: hypothetical protein WBP79_15045 [Candidatus Acidiferrales bacterium]
MPVCDGCGAQTDDAHIRRRIERLELATRFRPIHIQVLLLEAAPPASTEDYFYRSAPDRATRSLASRMYFDDLVKCADVAPAADLNEESALAEFQRHGFFLAYVVECPIEEHDEPDGVLNRLSATLLKRIQTSYKPKFIAPIGQPMQELIPFLELSGLANKLVLSNGGPFVDPFLGDPQNQVEFDTGIGTHLTRALARIS